MNPKNLEPVELEFKRNGWDPTKYSPVDYPSATATFRVRKDLMNLFSDPPPGIFVIHNDEDIMLIHAVIVGPMETPYEGGFYYFLLKCPNNYPIEPPKVKLITTDGGKVRFNPNLYKNGKICISILGTWTGPSWSPAQQISSLLVSIQSLMNEKPYFNEPGYTTERCQGDSAAYNEIIQHENLRVAVCGMLENDTGIFIPESLCEMIEKNFLTYYDQYVITAKSKVHLDGTIMRDPFGDERGHFNYTSILSRLENLHKKISEKWGNKDISGNESNNGNSK